MSYFAKSATSWIAVALSLLLAAPALLAQNARDTIIALDLGMSGEQLQEAIDMSDRLLSIAPEGHSVGLIVADEIVHHVLDPLPALQLRSELKLLASELSPSQYSNYAAVLERAIALAKDSPADSTVMLITSGTINAQNASRNDRNRQWAHSILMPDAAASQIQLVVTTPGEPNETLQAALAQASASNRSFNWSTPGGTGTIANSIYTATTATTLALRDTPTPVDEQATARAEAEAKAEAQAKADALAAANAKAREDAARAAAQAQADADAKAAADAAAQAQADAAAQTAAQTSAETEASTATGSTASSSDTPGLAIIIEPPAEKSSANMILMALAALGVALLAIGGWLFARARSSASSRKSAANPTRSRAAPPPAPFPVDDDEGDATVVKQGTDPAIASAVANPVSEHPQAAAAPPTATVAMPEDVDADMQTMVNTDSHAFRNPDEDKQTATSERATAAETPEPATAAADTAAADTSDDNQAETMVTNLSHSVSEAAGIESANPDDEFDVFERSIKLKKATGNQKASARRDDLRSITQDRHENISDIDVSK